MAERIIEDILIVSRRQDVTRLVLETLAARAVRGTVVDGIVAAAKRLGDRDWRLVLAELDGDVAAAAELMARVRAVHPELPVVMIAADDSVQTAVGAMRAGCRDVIEPPVTREKLESVLNAYAPSHAVPLAASGAADARRPYRIAGQSRRLRETIALAEKVAATSLPVLITGESGTGKELISRMIHDRSRRSSEPFVAVNCGAMSESLLESELFGHERGAFTGAHARRVGRFEQAHGGTLLLDEVSETSPRLQAELLRVLEQQYFERVGGSDAVDVNVRVISTSNRNLARDVEQGAFRRDLYYRLGGVQISVVPLRERIDDIAPLVWHFVNSFAGEVGRNIEQLDEEMLVAFRSYAWPGNVRQLRNVVRTALALGKGPTLSLAGVPALWSELRCPQPRNMSTLSLAELERSAIYEALRRTEAHQAKAAELLGITDRTLREKLRRYKRDGYAPPDAFGRTGERQWATA
ncbi:MAG: sigma-54-dependent Fis family transcriptional regulator [Phycisphaerae bacterium]|nr:sigma-54-dependent Fis family transcriptional regulator [Phycisphaerae bacterium]